MGMGYPFQSLGDFLRIKHGFAFRGEHFVEAGDHVLLTPGNFEAHGGLKLKGDKEKYYDGDIPRDFVLKRGDLIVAMTDLTQNAPILGAPAWVPEDNRFLHNQRLGKVIDLDERKLDRGYLYYLLNLPDTRDQLKATATGATVKHTAPERIYRVRAPVPPLPMQRRIADILSAYDDLIENNTKRIKILEEMAGSLYREWFVNFRFPGHEKVKMVSSPVGKVPVGWRAVHLDEISAFISRGVSPKYADDGPGLVLNQKCIRGQRLLLEAARRHMSKVPAERYVSKGDVLINSTGVGTLGRVAQVLDEPEGWTVDTHVTIARPKDEVDAIFYGLMLLGKQDHFESSGVGATGQTELNRARIAATDVLLPSLTLATQFGAIVAPMRILSLTLEKKNVVLRQTRDVLLPRLVSGQIDVAPLRAS